jgi:hypothetical protein
VTDLSDVKARLHRLPLGAIIAMTWRIKLARLFLWVARVTDRYDGVLMRIVQQIVKSVERCAIKTGRFAEKIEAVTYDHAAIMRDAHNRSETASASSSSRRTGNACGNLVSLAEAGV